MIQQQAKNSGKVLERLIEISEKELKNQGLGDKDYEFIKNFGNELESLVSGVDKKVKRQQ